MLFLMDRSKLLATLFVTAGPNDFLSKLKEAIFILSDSESGSSTSDNLN